MVREAEEHAAQDQVFRDKAEAKNSADQSVYQAERTLKDLGDKAPAPDKTRIEEAVAAVKSAIDSDNTDRIKSATEELRDATYKLSEMLYKQSESAGAAEGNGFHAGAAGPTEETTRPKEDVIDAEFKSE
jgi:molecular chaperone DnaK